MSFKRMMAQEKASELMDGTDNNCSDAEEETRVQRRIRIISKLRRIQHAIEEQRPEG